MTKHIDYEKRAEEHLSGVARAVVAGGCADVHFAKRLESLARRIRRHAEKNYQKPSTRARYGRMCTANRKQYRKDVNYLYWETDSSVAQIANHLGISQSSVAKLIERKKT